MTNSSLYKDEGIVLDDDWINKYNIEIGQSNNDDNTNSVESQSDQNNASTDLTYLNIDEYDVLNEDEVEPIAGVTDTMSTATDFLQENERQNILNVAPAEGTRPLSEELAYPRTFVGQPRPEMKQRQVNETKIHSLLLPRQEHQHISQEDRNEDWQNGMRKNEKESNKEEEKEKTYLEK
ncbi:hypothetical protein AWC38_SpisGene20114 [Stylophora pistillata]|uniref:Uncharacterized protein n=1 Tax=Stylophora pistillata TaxID=50429 RepID=A0A2B4RDE4_STYPI|nr:hypothetical protein AWC38_SpisGene20114 [Stylophora pistillata]